MMKRNPNKREITKISETKLQAAIAELSEISERREKERVELDRIAKMLVRRDLELTEIREKREKELAELERKTKELEDSREAVMSILEDVEKSRKALVNILEDAEEARRQALEERDKTLSIINNFADGLIVFDKENNLSLINPQAENLFGIETKEIIGKSILKLGSFSPLRPLVKLLGKEIKGVFRKELKIQENLILEISTISIMKEMEKMGTLVILHDVTREKIVEKLKTEFVSIAAHQLRTPLSVIKWSLSLLKEEKMTKREERDLFEKVFLSNERMIKLINDLLNVTRIEEGRYLYSPELKDAVEILKESIQAPKEEAERRGIQFKLSPPKEKVPKIKVDEEKIILAIQNIVGNAIHYTEPGGEVIISLKYDKEKKEILFKVRDTGIGIPKHQQQRVFQKFFRGENVMKMETEGTGLGLFITKNVIEAHGGKIWFKSEEGKGTTFYFTLPVS